MAFPMTDRLCRLLQVLQVSPKKKAKGIKSKGGQWPQRTWMCLEHEPRHVQGATEAIPGTSDRLMSATGYTSALQLLLYTGRRSSLGQKEHVWDRCFQPPWQEHDSHSRGQEGQQRSAGKSRLQEWRKDRHTENQRASGNLAASQRATLLTEMSPPARLMARNPPFVSSPSRLLMPFKTNEKRHFIYILTKHGFEYQIQSFGNACFTWATSRSWLTWADIREASAQFWTHQVSIGCHQQMYFTGVWFCSPTSKQFQDLKSKLIDWNKKFEKVSFFKPLSEKCLVFYEATGNMHKWFPHFRKRWSLKVLRIASDGLEDIPSNTILITVKALMSKAS